MYLLSGVFCVIGMWNRLFVVDWMYFGLCMFMLVLVSMIVLVLVALLARSIVLVLLGLWMWVSIVISVGVVVVVMSSVLRSGWSISWYTVSRFCGVIVLVIVASIVLVIGCGFRFVVCAVVSLFG